MAQAKCPMSSIYNIESGSAAYHRLTIHVLSNDAIRARQLNKRLVDYLTPKSGEIQWILRFWG